MAITETPTGKYRHRLAMVKESTLGSYKPVLILQQKIHFKGTYHSPDPDGYDVHGLPVDHHKWRDCDTLPYD